MKKLEPLKITFLVNNSKVGFTVCDDKTSLFREAPINNAILSEIYINVKLLERNEEFIKDIRTARKRIGLPLNGYNLTDEANFKTDAIKYKEMVDSAKTEAGKILSSHKRNFYPQIQASLYLIILFNYIFIFPENKASINHIKISETDLYDVAEYKDTLGEGETLASINLIIKNPMSQRELIEFIKSKWASELEPRMKLFRPNLEAKLGDVSELNLLIYEKYKFEGLPLSKILKITDAYIKDHNEKHRSKKDHLNYLDLSSITRRIKLVEEHHEKLYSKKNKKDRIIEKIKDYLHSRNVIKT